jgi:hypothetical protein
VQAAAHGLEVRFADLLFDNPFSPTSYSFHPNAAGQKAYAGVVAACYARVTSCGSDPYK